MITKLRSYRANAEVLGEVREVEFDGDVEALVIKDVDIVDAGKILNRLSDKGIVGVSLPESPAPEDAPRAESAPKDGAPAVAGAPPAPPPPPPPAEPEKKPKESKEMADAKDAPSEIPAEVAAAGTFGKIVEYLTNVEKLDTVEQVLAACLRYRDRSPVLQRVRDLEDRVKAFMG